MENLVSLVQSHNFFCFFQIYTCKKSADSGSGCLHLESLTSRKGREPLRGCFLDIQLEIEALRYVTFSVKKIKMYLFF